MYSIYHDEKHQLHHLKEDQYVVPGSKDTE